MNCGEQAGKCFVPPMFILGHAILPPCHSEAVLWPKNPYVRPYTMGEQLPGMICGLLFTPLHPASLLPGEYRVLASLPALQPRVFPSVPVVAQESLTSGLHTRRSGQRRLVLHGSDCDRG